MSQFAEQLSIIDFTAVNNNMTIAFAFRVNDFAATLLQVESIRLQQVTEIIIDPNDPDPSASTQTDIFYATQSTQQFQYPYANSMAEYSAVESGGVFQAKFMTLFDVPVLFEGYPLDLAIILPDNELYPPTNLSWKALGQNRNILMSGTSAINYQDEGVYRFTISDIAYPASAHYIEVEIDGVIDQLSETKLIKINKSNCRQGVFLCWLNYLGGWDSWLFDGYQNFGVSITDSQETTRDIFNIWDAKFAQGTTETDYVRIESRGTRQLRSGHLSESEVDAIRWVRQSIKVQEIQKDQDCTEQTRKTVLVAKGTFDYKTTKRGLREIDFSLRETNQDIIQTN
jgi:hypothetical protein